MELAKFSKMWDGDLAIFVSERIILAYESFVVWLDIFIRKWFKFCLNYLIYFEDIQIVLETNFKYTESYYINIFIKLNRNILNFIHQCLFIFFN